MITSHSAHAFNKLNRTFKNYIPKLCYFYSLSICIIKRKGNGEKFLLIFYTKLIRADVIISFDALSSIWNSINSRVQRKYHFFVPNSQNGIIDCQRDPTARKRENLLTWFPRRCHIRFRSWHILSVKLVFFFFRVALMSSSIDGRSVDLRRCVEILFDGFIRWNFDNDYFRKRLTGIFMSSTGKSERERIYLWRFSAHSAFEGTDSEHGWARNSLRCIICS